MKDFCRYICLLFFCLALASNPAVGESSAPRSQTQRPLKLGVLASLSGFAAKHGTAVLEGVTLAKLELEAQGFEIELQIEDDQSQMKNTVTAYHRLAHTTGVQAIICGTWWMESIVKIAEQDQMLLLSAETVLTNHTTTAASYFILGGDLKEWIRIFEPIIRQRQLRRAGIVYASSDFAETIAKEFNSLFAKENRKLVFSAQYSSLDAVDVLPKLLHLRKAKVDVLYIEGQPEGLSNVLRELKKLQLTDLTILSNSIVETVIENSPSDFNGFTSVFYTTRENHAESFRQKFSAYWKRSPALNSDLAFYSALLAADALKYENPIAALKSGNLLFDTTPFRVSDKNVFYGAPQQVKQLRPK